nr:MAG TPA: hypothetical protein [Caudoviricetes sp.]
MNDSIKQARTVIKNRLNLKSRNITRSLTCCIINNF